MYMNFYKYHNIIFHNMSDLHTILGFLYIGVGTILKVGARLPLASPQNFEGETSPIPKISFLLRFRPLYFRENANDVKKLGTKS